MTAAFEGGGKGVPYGQMVNLYVQEQTRSKGLKNPEKSRRPYYRKFCAASIVVS